MSKLYTPLDNQTLRCELCFRHCRIAEGARGFCGVNGSVNGELCSLVYGQPDAMQIDPIEKKPLYHFYPGTNILSLGTIGCNFRCPFCQNSHLSFGKLRPKESVTNKEIIDQALRRNVPVIAFTYNEPTINWLWYRDLAKDAKATGLKTVMVTNGSMSTVVAEEMIRLIDAVNIDLKSGSSSTYRTQLQGNLETVLKSSAFLFKEGVWVELTTLIVPGISSSPKEFSELAGRIQEEIGTNLPWHLSAYHPAHTYVEPATPHSDIEPFREILARKGFCFVYEGNTGYGSDTRCPQCGDIVLSRKGYEVHKNMINGSCGSCGRSIEGRFV